MTVPWGMRRLAPLALTALLACGDPAPGTDAGEMCLSDLECSDGTFCNGVERCAPTAEDADDQGCIGGAPPCAPGQSCEEAEGRCVTMCPITEDADGDGARATECGGDDCDDADPERFPGNAEVCDPEGHDEDCDPSTVGERDADGDGAIDALCCNGERCGPDCDDGSAAVSPTSIEVCNGTDDDCDGAADEGVLRVFYPDGDGDGFGDRDGEVRRLCAAEEGFVENALDCEDTDRTINPVRSEVCNGRDDNCDGDPDEEPAVIVACAATFGSPPNTPFACVDGACATACAGRHDDCNGELSDGCETDLLADPNNCGVCGTSCGVGGACTDGVCDRVVDVAAGAGHSCAVRSSGRVVCWGKNESGQLGDGSVIERHTPVLVRGLEDAREVGATFSNFPFSQNTTCARTDSLVWCWGGNENGQVGNGEDAGFEPVPVPVFGVPGFGSMVRGVVEPNLAVGGQHACVNENFPEGATGFRSTTCWGRNLGGVIASFGGAPSEYPTPRQAQTYPNGTFDVRVGAGEAHLCASFTRPGGRMIRCRGDEPTGGGGPVLGPSGGGDFAFGLDTLDAGFRFTCGIERAAASSDPGSVFCWGVGTGGQLGNGRTANNATPQRVLGPSGGAALDDAVALAVGHSFACAVRAGGEVLCWGNNSFGQLGDGSTTQRARPIPVAGITDAVAIAAGHRHACVVHATGRVSCWGSNRNGELGRDETSFARETPAEVLGL